MSDKKIYYCQIRIYSEDTDLFGIVYHANYLRLYERARTELFRSKGIALSDSVKDGFLYTIRQTNVRYILPARLDDLLTVETKIDKLKPCSATFCQQIINIDGKVINKAEIDVVCIDDALKPQRMPAVVRECCSL